ncbi:DotA/TraY family protein [Burkholderia contaminans]|uniref:DotA/TraY family protein n=1 Tax=Burkholderia contaminans TaxID=488447 RepID=UPI0018DDBD4C|nr:DotA/TraY family protein [Burkholderia contaminans]MBH9720219.1 DotA/TraY family protein [Burkholderia contaminans]
MKAIIKILMVLSLVLIPSLSFAGDLGLTPMTTDKMMMVMNSIFGKLGVFGGESSDSMAGLIEIVNISALFCAGILFVYYVIFATVGTAHDGEFMGKKFSGVYLPIRLALVPALLLPINNGYNSIQYLTGKVITAGISFADAGASKFMSNQNLIQVAQTGLIKPEVNSLAYNLFASYACMNVMKQFQQNYNQAKLLFPNMTVGITKEDGMNNIIYKFGDKNGQVDACGTLTVSKWQAPAVDTSQSLQNVATGPLGAITNLVQASDAVSRMQAISQKNQEETANLMNKMDTLSAQLVSSGAPIDPKLIADAVGQYRENVNSFASQQILSLDQFSELKKSVDQDGFIFLGAYYQKISKLMDLTNSAIANVPVASGVSHFDGYPLHDEWSKALNNIGKVVDLSSAGVVNYGVGDETGGSNESWWDTIKHSVKEGFSPVPIIKKLFTSAGTMTFDKNENAVLKVERIGGWSGAVASAVYVGIGALSSSIGNAPGIGMFLNVTLITFIPPIMMFAFWALYIVPMLPFFIWIGCIMALVISYAETIIGSTLWLVAILFEGHEIIGQGSNGFKQLLSILFKPLLMVAGFALSVSIVQIIGSLITSIFPDVWNLAQSDSGLLTYVLGMFAMPVVYVGMMTYLIKKCFDIVHVLPDQVINWIGGLGVSMSGHGKEASGAGAIAGAGAVAMASQGASKALNNKINQDRINNEKKMADFDRRTDNPETREERTRNSNKAESSILDNLEYSGNTLKGAQAQSMLNKAVNMVVGKDSVEGNEFMNQMKDSIERNPDSNFEQQLNSAMNKHLIDKYGSGSGRVVAMAGGGYFTDSAKETMGVFKSAQSSLDKTGMSDIEVKDTISTANSNAMNSFETDKQSVKKGGNMGLGDYFVKEINKSLPQDLKIEERNVEMKPTVY